jgi:3'(2'), 5'-bisphosphate nucleotidase
MYAHELAVATDIVAEASRLARQAQDAIVAAGAAVAKDDRSPVTLADLAIQVVVSHRLAEYLPGDALLGEESSDILRANPELARGVLERVNSYVPGLDAAAIERCLDRGDAASTARGRTWVLDPIDGTKGFLRGDHYAVALALVVDGTVVLGFLGCPNLEFEPGNPMGPRGVLFSAVRGRGATVRAVDGGDVRPIATDDLVDPSRARFCESVESAHAAHSDQARIAQDLGITAPHYRIDSQCKYGIVARGEASIYLRLPKREDYREKIWDHAAGAIVVEEAGGRVSDLDGHPLDFSEGRLLGVHRGIVATNGHIHDRVLDACRRVAGD